MRPTRACLLLSLLSLWVGLVACGEVASPLPELPRLLETPDFALTNLDGRTVTRELLQGRVLVVNFIFTRCGGPCPLMTRQMRTLQQALIAEGMIEEEDSEVLLVSITVDPEHDTPEVLAQYAQLWEADTESWLFLTGPPDETLRIVREGFRVTAEREGSGMDHPDILHSTSFLLVDRNGWVRRIVSLTEDQFVESLIHDMNRLLAEPDA